MHKARVWENREGLLLLSSPPSTPSSFSHLPGRGLKGIPPFNRRRNYGKREKVRSGSRLRTSPISWLLFAWNWAKQCRLSDETEEVDKGKTWQKGKIRQ